ncbi:unnamed protein product [Urochloa decumbens]|uniref:Uncharacterized protein n=1 Tax=Urochloa decumbens TaxID=240449 RepID=A0ABC9B1F1_9POAL
MEAVIVVHTLASYVGKLISDMTQEEVHMLLGIPSEITKLEDNMENLKAFLKDAERRCITDESVKRWVRKFKDAMYDATDILDLCQLEAERRRESKVPDCSQSLLFFLRNPKFSHTIGSRIKKLNQRLDSLRKGALEFNFNNLGSYQDIRVPANAEHNTSHRTMSEFDEYAIVGEKIKRETKELVQVLIANDDQNLKVVSIVGMGGMGKTTLAQKIFKEESIQKHFKTKIWLSINQHFDEIELLRSAIKHAGGDHAKERDISLLVQNLTKVLSKKKFLLVMDDMWREKAWSDVFQVPITNASHKQPGSRVLVTTRFEDLAPKMRAASYQHHVSPLDKEDAWSLLKKQLPPNQVLQIDSLKDVGMEILKKCDGLPLAIKVVGGLLSTRYPSAFEWKSVLNSPSWSVDGLPQQLNKPLYLSYEDLSPQLKQCFLYCSLISKSKDIVQDEVTRMWISEGFIQPPHGGTTTSLDRLEEFADEYYKDLIKRNLIEPIVRYSHTEYKCRMHDVVCSFAEYVGREEYLVVHDEQAIKDASVHLKHLRYLHLQDTNISRLPYDISKMKFLWYITLICCKKLCHIPSSIIKLVHIRSLDIRGSNIHAVPKGFSGLTNLRFLQEFPVHTDMDGGWCSLEELVPLSQLKDLTLEGLENVPASAMAEKVMISSKGHLSYLVLKCNQASGQVMGLGNKEQQQQKQSVMEEVLEKLCPPSCLENLTVKSGYIRRLPSWMQASASVAYNSLRYLILEDLHCCTQLPNGLCCLPSLEVLTIRNAPAIKHIGPEFQVTFSLVASFSDDTSPPFPKLRRLQLDCLREWEEWEWNDSEDSKGVKFRKDVQWRHLSHYPDHSALTSPLDIAMPSLETLHIKHCRLSCLPPGLANSKRHALRELYLYDIRNLTSVVNFPSVVELDVFRCPEIRRIADLSRLQRITIVHCPSLEVLEGVPELDSIVLKDPTMVTLPGYLRGVSPRYLDLLCRKKLHDSIVSGSSTECDKISHINTRGTNYYPQPRRVVSLVESVDKDEVEPLPESSCFPSALNTRQTCVGVLHSANHLALGKEPVSGSEQCFFNWRYHICVGVLAIFVMLLFVAWGC